MMVRSGIFALLFFLLGCVSTNQSPKLASAQQVQAVGPMVQHWMKSAEAAAGDSLSVLIKSNTPLNDYTFLKPMGKKNLYSGYLSKSNLERLQRDKRILRITSTKKQLQ